MPDTPSPLITVRNLSMELGGNLILDDVSFRMDEGDVLGIIGRSGAGKSIHAPHEGYRCSAHLGLHCVSYEWM
jgi:ABC-type glutathione transport system ATPase component